MALPHRSTQASGPTTSSNGQRDTRPRPEAVVGAPSPAWQLEMFDCSLKKRQKLALLLRLLGPLDGQRCLLVTGGDNTGALNFHLRAAGGRWTWAEMEETHIDEIETLLGEPVERAGPERLPFPDECFDRVVSIDVHEHLHEVKPLNREIARVLTPTGSAVITTPNGNTRLPVALLKRLLRMGPEVYGHRVQGYTSEELEAMALEAGLVPERHGAYSRFFTESIELAINFAWVKVLGRGKDAGDREGADGDERDEGIAPSSRRDLGRVGGAYRVYRRVFPVLRAVAALDHLIPGRGGYAVAVSARKPGRKARRTPPSGSGQRAGPAVPAAPAPDLHR